mmetsp:Transcript_26672/g.52369  ORF Transcript_26672/g.52369 Transcript_26672/m.52369 type:complete len:148 (-) Transcript_26672:1830-2273(-)
MSLSIVVKVVLPFRICVSLRCHSFSFHVQKERKGGGSLDQKTKRKENRGGASDPSDGHGNRLPGPNQKSFYPSSSLFLFFISFTHSYARLVLSFLLLALRFDRQEVRESGGWNVTTALQTDRQAGRDKGSLCLGRPGDGLKDKRERT